MRKENNKKIEYNTFDTYRCYFRNVNQVFGQQNCANIKKIIFVLKKKVKKMIDEFLTTKK